MEMATVLIKLNATIKKKLSAKNAAAPAPIYSGKLIKRLVRRAIPVPKKQATASEGITNFKPFLYRYIMDGNKIYAVVAKIFASSPTPPVLPVGIRITSFKTQTITPSTGPNKKAISKIKVLPKSSFKKGVAGKMGKSNKLTQKDSATNTAINAIRFAEKRFLSTAFSVCFFVAFSVEQIPAPTVCKFSSCFCTSNILILSIKIPRIFGAYGSKPKRDKRRRRFSRFSSFPIRTLPSVSELHRIGKGATAFLRRLYCRWGISPRPKEYFYCEDIITVFFKCVKQNANKKRPCGRFYSYSS